MPSPSINLSSKINAFWQRKAELQSTAATGNHFPWAKLPNDCQRDIIKFVPIEQLCRPNFGLYANRADYDNALAHTFDFSAQIALRPQADVQLTPAEQGRFAHKFRNIIATLRDENPTLEKLDQAEKDLRNQRFFEFATKNTTVPGMLDSGMQKLANRLITSWLRLPVTARPKAAEQLQKALHDNQKILNDFLHIQELPLARINKQDLSLPELARTTDEIHDPWVRAAEHTAIREKCDGDPATLAILIEHSQQIEDLELRSAEHVKLYEAAQGHPHLFDGLKKIYRDGKFFTRAVQHTEVRRRLIDNGGSENEINRHRILEYILLHLENQDTPVAKILKPPQNLAQALSFPSQRTGTIEHAANAFYRHNINNVDLLKGSPIEIYRAFEDQGFAKKMLRNLQLSRALRIAASIPFVNFPALPTLCAYSRVFRKEQLQ